LTRGHWWQAFLAFIWSTAERKSAALALRWEWIDRQKMRIVIPSDVRKGRVKTAVYVLWPEVWELLERIQKPEWDIVFPWPGGTYYHHFARINKRAGIHAGRKFKTHCLRVSHATWLQVFGGDATKALIHGTAHTRSRTTSTGR
jgi:integrase